MIQGIGLCLSGNRPTIGYPRSKVKPSGPTLTWNGRVKADHPLSRRACQPTTVVCHHPKYEAVTSLVEVCKGSWLCKNSLAKALTARDGGGGRAPRTFLRVWRVF